MAWGALPDWKHILKECIVLEKPVSPSFKGKPSLLGWSMGCHYLSEMGYSAVRPPRREGPRTVVELMDTRWDGTDFTSHTTLSYRSTCTTSDSSLLKWRWQQQRSPRVTLMMKSENTWKNLGTKAGTWHALKETSGQSQAHGTPWKKPRNKAWHTACPERNLRTKAGTQHALKETSGQNQTLAYVK